VCVPIESLLMQIDADASEGLRVRPTNSANPSGVKYDPEAWVGRWRIRAAFPIGTP
jgi:hypothetical protein